MSLAGMGYRVTLCEEVENAPVLDTELDTTVPVMQGHVNTVEIVAVWVWGTAAGVAATGPVRA